MKWISKLFYKEFALLQSIFKPKFKKKTTHDYIYFSTKINLEEFVMRRKMVTVSKVCFAIFGPKKRFPWQLNDDSKIAFLLILVAMVTQKRTFSDNLSV